MKISYLAFTDHGMALAWRLSDRLPGNVMRCGQPLSLDQWTRNAFSQEEALVYVGAVGIAVRAIAPYLCSKTTDPAVVVVDEGGNFAVSLLSGHIGGANDLARQIAAVCDAQPVITTATDTRGIFAVDSWAKKNGIEICNPSHIKTVSGKLLSGARVMLQSDYPITGECPQGIQLVDDEKADITLSLRKNGQGLRLVPRILFFGIGCRKGISAEAVELLWQHVMQRLNIAEEAVYSVCTIDIKNQEAGLNVFCRMHHLPMQSFSAGELASVKGDFSASAFVAEKVGVDNVCERSAVLGSGGKLIMRKTAENGVTMAIAEAPFQPDWSIGWGEFH